MNNQISFCSYDVQQSASLREQLRTVVDNVMRLFFDCPELRYTRTRRRYTLLELPVLRRNFESWKEAINVLPSSTKYKGLGGYFCDNAVYSEIW